MQTFPRRAEKMRPDPHWSLAVMTHNPSNPSETDATLGSQPEQSDDASEKTGISGSNEPSRSSSRRSRGKRGKRAKAAAQPQQDNRYKTTGQLGRGGWGVVERAIDRQLQRPVAIKRILSSETVSESVRDRFLYEARITSQLQHPGIVPVHELADGGQAAETYYVMKLLSGRPLRQLIRDTHAELEISNSRRAAEALREATLPLLERFIDVCDAIAYAHQQGILHRDLKPDNVMIGGFGETIVVDWGLAKRLDDAPVVDSDVTLVPQPPPAEPQFSGPATPRTMDSAPLDDSAPATPRELEAAMTHVIDQAIDQVDEALSGTDRTAAGTVIGTPAYMPPEQARGDIDAMSAASDIFSLGAMLYEIIVGKHPHAGHKITAVLERVENGARTPAAQARPGVPRALSAICECAMAYDSTARYASAAELADDVRRFIAGDPVSVDQETWLDRAARWCRRHRTLAVSLAGTTTVLLLTSVVYGYLIHQAHEAERLAHLETQAAHEETLTRLEQSRRAADAWLIDLSGSLQFYPGLQPIRQELIDQAILHYQGLLSWERRIADEKRVAEQNAPEYLDARVDLERAKVHLRLGDLHRLNQAPDEAVAQYAAAAELLQRHSSARQQDSTLNDDLRLQQINVLIGNLLTGKADPSSIEPAEHWLRERLAAYGIDSHLADERPTSDFAYDIASCLARLGLTRVRIEEATSDQSAAAGKTASHWARWLVRSRGTSADHRLSQTTLTQWATESEQLADFAAAAAVWRQLVDELETQTLESPGRVDHRQSLAHARLKWGNAEVKSAPQDPTQRELARQQYELAIADLQQAWALADADGFYQTNLAAAENNLGLLLSQGTPEQRDAARNHLMKSVDFRRRLMRQQPTVDGIRLFCETIGKLVELTDETDAEALLRWLNDADLGYQLIRDHGRLSAQDRVAWAKLLRRRADRHAASGNKEAALIDRAAADQLQPTIPK